MGNLVKHVFIAGGTGFLGYYAGLDFLKKMVKVSSIALPNELTEDNIIPKEFHLSFGNLFEMTEEELDSLFSNQEIDTLVYALGPDDRYTPTEDAYLFFYDRLVLKAKRILESAKRSKIKRAVVLNSYFSYFDRINHSSLSNKHPYIKARRMQEAVLEALGVSGKFDVMFIELPYIFGTMEGRKPLWGEAFLDRVETKNGIFFPSGGGTAAIDVRNVARAIVGAAFYGENHGKYAIGDECILFKDMLDAMLEAKGSKSKVKEVPPILAAIGAYFIGRKERKAGKKSGLNHFWLMLQIQNKHFFIEPKKYQEILHFKELGYIEDFDVVESIKKTIKICYQK